jgi:NAD(P)-dependent dehydrogenase (short-subunit alcohol dehydrogenase family)
MLGANDLFSLTGKNVLITGGVGILGKVFVEAFLSQGANVAIVDIDQSAIDDFTKIMEKKFSTKIKGYQCDISSEENVKTLMRKVIADFEKIHVLHNNAASKSSDLNKFFAPFEDYPLETWREIMSVNIDGMFLMAKHVGKHMIDAEIKGSIIQTASIYGVCAPDQRIYDGSFYLGRQINTPAVYSASKAAVIGLTQYLSAYWGAKGIRVNTLTPGGMESGQNSTFVEKYSNRVPMNRMGKPTELVGALIYLASDTSSYVTGQNIIVDGGLSVW